MLTLSAAGRPGLYRRCEKQDEDKREVFNNRFGEEQSDGLEPKHWRVLSVGSHERQQESASGGSERMDIQWTGGRWQRA